MLQELRGPGGGEEDGGTEAPSARSPHTEDPRPAGRGLAWQRGGAGCPGSCRALGHPSFQPFYSAVWGCSRPPPPEGPPGEAGPPPSLDCSSFFYTDPTQPPGYRIYNWLSCSSMEVLRRPILDTPAPIMAPQETPPAPAVGTRRRWLSGEELQAVSALLELPVARVGSGARQGDP